MKPLNEHGLSEAVRPDGNQFGHIEARGIDYIPDVERHGRARELFLVWMAPNIIYLDIILGGAMMKLGLGIWPVIAVIVAGNAYWLLVGLVSVSGSRSGTAGAVVMRAMFGVRANRVNVACCVWGIMVAHAEQADFPISRVYLPKITSPFEIPSFFDGLVGGAPAPEALRDISRRGSCVLRSYRDLTHCGHVRCGLDLKFSNELSVVLPSGPLGLQVSFLRLHGAIHVGRPREDCVIAGRRRGELVGE